MPTTNDESGAVVHSPRPLVDGARVALPSRCRLVERLIEETAGSAGMQRLTLVCAPTGYGKTATIADWLGGEGDALFPSRWVHCSPAGPLAMWTAIAETLAQFSDDEIDIAADPLQAVSTLARRLRVGLTLVIDDFQLVTDAATDMALAELSAVSSKLTLVVIGRRVTLLDGPFVTATTRVRVINADDLSFTQAEALDLVQSLSIPLTAEVSAALDRADGWPLAIGAALNLGSDALYATVDGARVWADGPAARAFDPLANLSAFALGILAIMNEDARTVTLAASQVDSLSSTQLREVLSGPEGAAASTLQDLTDLGLLVESPGMGVPEYRVHQSLRTPIAEHAAGVISDVERRRLYRGRAQEIAGSAPFTAFRLFCSAEAFDDAEVVLAQNFTTITDEISECAKILRALPEEALRAHPTLTAALLFLETPLPGVAPSRLSFFTRLWQLGIQERLPGGVPSPNERLHLPLMCQTMVMHRVLGDLDSAGSLMHHIEQRLEPDRAPAAPFAADEAEATPAVVAGNGSLSGLYRELAATALAVGDFTRARRALKRLRRHSERKITTPWHGFPHASTRTVTDPESGTRWLLAALSELAFTDMIDGHIRRAGELIYEFDELAASTGATAPGISWVGAEVARMHLAQESGRSDVLETASQRLSTLSDRIEPWPLILIAESAAIRRTQGTEQALAHFTSGLADADGLTPVTKAWCVYVTNFEAMLNSSLGNLSRAEELLADGPEDSSPFRLERSRLAVFTGNDVDALLLAHSVGDPGATKRQRVDRQLLTSVAAWAIGRRSEAIAALTSAATLIDKYFLPAMLISVPFDLLHEVAVEARATGACDIVDSLDAIPHKARAQRYERLTEMELRTLAAISEHRNASQAAASLFVTAGTVKKHLAAVYRKLRVRDRDAAILRAGSMGLLDTSEYPAA